MSIVLMRPLEYFNNILLETLRSQKVNASEQAQFYLVNLLSNFVHMENLYPAAAGGKREETLALQLASALEEENHEARLMRLRRLGDTSLYIAGFFSDSLQKKLVDVDYYIEMGCTAYDQVAELEYKNTLAELFAELAKKFPMFVDVFSEISEEVFQKNSDNKTLLRIYDLWTKTGSERLAKKLARAGIVKNKNNPDDEPKQ